MELNHRGKNTLTFIPVNNDLGKALAFAPSLREDYHKDYKLSKPSNFINSIEAVKLLQKEGWIMDGISEQFDQRKATGHFIKMTNEDIKMGNEAKANIYIINDITVNKDPMNVALGLYRMVCSNGLWGFRGEKEVVSNENMLEYVLKGIEEEANIMIRQFERTKEYELDFDKQLEYAKYASKLRFGSKNTSIVEPSQILQCHRVEDQGNSVWNVFNRIQENITQPFKLKNKQGQNIFGVINHSHNQDINQELFKKMIMPYMN